MNLWPFANQPSLSQPWVMTSERIKLLAGYPAYESVLLQSATLIIPRKYLFYQCIEFESISRSLRTNLLVQRIRQLSPFNNPAHWQVSDGNREQVWFWAAERVIRMHHEQDLPTLSAVPETMLYPPLENGLRVQPCIEGWDLQYWSAKVLRHSRWFATQPSARDQADFMRVCGAAENEEWYLGDTNLLAKPWNEKAFWSKENLASEAVAPRLVLGLLLAWLTLQIGLSLGVQIHEKILAISVTSKNKQLKTLVRERDGALQQQEFNQAVATLVGSQTQLHLLAQVRACLPTDAKYSILDWQYQHGQLTLLVQQDNLDTRALIQACSVNAAFSEVHVEPGITPDQTRILFTLPEASIKKEGDNA